MPKDIQLAYREQGSGFPLILLHGNGESGAYFHHQLDYFAPYYRVIAVDTRGHGASPRGSAPFTLRQFADDLHDFFLEQGISQAHVLGFSDGGNIALYFASKYPNAVKSLILNGANLNPSGVRRSVQLPVELGYRFASCFAARSERAARNAELLGLMVHEPDLCPQQLSRLTMPALVIAGTRDMIRRSHTEQIARSLTRAQLVLIDGDHFIAEKRPEAFNRAVFYFLREQEI